MTDAPIRSVVELIINQKTWTIGRYPWDRLCVIGDVLVLRGSGLHEPSAALSLKKMAAKRKWNVSYHMETPPKFPEVRMIIRLNS